MSQIRHLVNRDLNAANTAEVLKADTSKLTASGGFVFVNILSGTKYRRVRIKLEDILSIPGIAEGLPTTDPGIPGSLWVDNGFLKVSA